MTYQYTHICNGDYRNEGWTFGGSGVSACWQAWNNDDDTKYASCPGYRGRACVSFPIDISSGSIPDGAVITSVSIWIRVRRMFAEGKSVTVNLLSTDDTSKYTSRTIYPSSSVQNYEVGTYKTDPLGNPWTKDRLNRMMAQVFSYSVPPNDGVRVYKLWAIVNYKVRPTLTITAPTGTVTTATPTVAWTYTHPEGDLQKSAQYNIFTAAQQSVTDFNPEKSTPVFSGTVSGDITSFTLPQPLSPDNYYIYVRSQSVYGCWSIWQDHTFTVAGAAPGAPGGAAFDGVGTGGSGGFETVVVDDEGSNAYLTLRDGSNLLSVQQADFETTTDTLGFTATNCTLLQDSLTTAFGVGAGSMRMTSTTTSTMYVDSSFMQVSPNTPITARAQFRAATIARSTEAWLLFFDENYAPLSTASLSNTGGTETVGSYTETTVTGTTPDSGGGKLYAQLELRINSTAIGEVHNLDKVGVMYGTNSAWSHGGHMSRNLLSSDQSSGDGTGSGDYTAQSGSTYNGRVTSLGTGARGSNMFKATYAGLSPSVSYVATGTAYSDNTNGTGYTLNKPAGVVDGDVLVAYVAADAGYATPPSGWSLVDRIDSGGGTATTLTVLMRDGLTSDGSSWVGNTTVTGNTRRAVVVAYRGAASTDTQLSKENVASSLSGSLNQRTPVLNNTDPNAWRLSCFAFRDDVSGGTMVANTQLPSSIPGISYVGRGGNWWYGGSLGSYQVNKPTGVVSGDLMLAFGAFAGTANPTAPTGWTQVSRNVATTGNGDDHSGTGTFVVWKRTAGSSEPSSWSASYTGTGTPLMTQTVAYRNCDVDTSQFIAQGVSSTTGNYTLNTATITNNDSRAWRVSAAMATTPYGDTMSSTETAERADYSTDVGNHPDVNMGVYDSNGPVSTGNHRRQLTCDTSNPWAMLSFICLLKPLTSAPSSGANETERHDGTTGSGSQYLTLGVYDTNGATTTGNQAVYGIFTPGSGTAIQSSAGWEGFLTPAATITAGEVGVTLTSYIDISKVPQAVLDRAGGKMSMTASLIGSTAGAPFLRMHFYNANELLTTRTASGVSFNTSLWTPSSATFDIPSGTTRVKIGVAASDRTVGDWIGWDKVGIMFGDQAVWRYGTGRANHPIYSVPIIEYADNVGEGYGPWAILPGSTNALLDFDQLTGICTYVDPTLVPGALRKYRASTISYGLAGETFASGYGAESDEIQLSSEGDWWLKDPTDSGTAIKLRVAMGQTTGNTGNTPDGVFVVNTTNTASVFQPLGSSRPIVLTEGYKGDSFTITVMTSGTAEFQDLRKLLNSGKTLFLQSNIDGAWWVRPVGDLPAEMQLTHDMWSNPLRFTQITFVEVDAE